MSRLTPMTLTTFAEDVLTAAHPVLVDFHASWCAPCVAQAPILEDLAEQGAAQLAVVSVDIDAEQGLARAYEIQAVPTLVLFVDGVPVERVVGAVARPVLIRRLAVHLPGLAL